MRSATLPIPRERLPTRALSRSSERKAARHLMKRLLAHTLGEFDNFLSNDRGRINSQRWKPVTSHETLQMFRERDAGYGSTQLVAALGDESLLPPGATLSCTEAPTVLVAGASRGRVESIMFGMTSGSQEDMALVNAFVHGGDVADCGTLVTLLPPDEEHPHHFLGAKFIVRMANAKESRFVDSVYLEYRGYTRSPTTGEQVGFYLLHAIDLPGFPDLRAFHSMRSRLSVRCLFHQQTDEVVDVFMLANTNVAGGNAGLKPRGPAMFTIDALFNAANMLECAEAKRLTAMKRKNQQRSHQGKTNECSMCRQKKKLFGGGGSFSACEVCSQYICGRCRVDKRVFVPNRDRITGRFEKISACKPCIVAAANGTADNQSQLVVTLSERRERNRSRAGSRAGSRMRGASSNSIDMRSRGESSCSSVSSSPPESIEFFNNWGNHGSNAGPSKDKWNVSTVSDATTVTSMASFSEMSTPLSPVASRRHFSTPQRRHESFDGILPSRQVEDNRSRALSVERQLQAERSNALVVAPSENWKMVPARRDMPQRSDNQRRFPLFSQTPSTHMGRVNSVSSGNASSPFYYHSLAINGGSYGSQRGPTPSPMPSAAPSTSYSQADLMARMMELNKMVNNTYDTTQRNGAYMAQHMMRSSPQ